MRPRTIAQTTLLLLLISLLVYLPMFGYGFFVDDDVYVGARNRVLPTLAVENLGRLLVERGNAWEFLPVRDLTYWLDMKLIGDGADAFHLGNLFWYGVCCYGVYRLVADTFMLYRDTSRDQAAMLAMIACLLFFLHPAHVEVVVWISGRKDILACGLYALGAAFYVRGLRLGWNLALLALSTVLLIAAVFSKSVALFALLVLPLVAINVRRWGLSVPARRFVLYAAVPAIVAAAALFVHMRVGAETGIGIDNAPGFPALLERASRILTTLIGIVVLPTRLRLICDIYALGEWHWLVSSLALIVALGAAGTLCLGRRSLASVAVLLVLVPMVAYLQFSPFVTWSMASERFAFQATLGWVMLLVCLERVVGKEVFLALVLLLAASYLREVVPRVAQWESPRVLRAYDVHAFPGHHSAAREFVIAHLLPEKDYTQAREVAAQVRSPMARDFLLRLIDADQAMRADIANGARSTKRYRQYCAIAKALDSDLANARGAVRTLADTSLVNFAGHLRAYLNRGLADVSVICLEAGEAAGTATRQRGGRS